MSSKGWRGGPLAALLSSFRDNQYRETRTGKKRGGNVTRPAEFQEAYIATQNIPYLRASPHYLARSGGVLAKGQLIWVHTMSDIRQRPHSIFAFVDDIGLVSLDPGWLKKCDEVR